jgi:hypothetical protein
VADVKPSGMNCHSTCLYAIGSGASIWTVGAACVLCILALASGWTESPESRLSSGPCRSFAIWATCSRPLLFLPLSPRVAYAETQRLDRTATQGVHGVHVFQRQSATIWMLCRLTSGPGTSQTISL